MLNDKDRAEKQLRAMMRELERLEKRRRHPPVHELIPPIQSGWKRHYVLTPAARLRPDAETLTAILDCLNTVQYFWRSDFRRSRRQQRRRGLVAIEQELLAIHWRQWDEEPVPPSWRKYFRRELLRVERLRKWPRRDKTENRYPCFAHANRQHDWGYAFRFAFWFELKVEKHWLTHCTEIEPGVAGRIAEIERWLDFHHGRERFQRLKGCSDWWSYFERSPQRRCERQIKREMRAHLGLLGDVAAEHIPSNQPRWGARRVGCFQPLRFWREPTQIFAVVRLEILRLQTPDMRPGSLTGYRHAGQGS